eukprot:4666297-Prymnesium_polylepis.1
MEAKRMLAQRLREVTKHWLELWGERQRGVFLSIDGVKLQRAVRKRGPNQPSAAAHSPSRACQPVGPVHGRRSIAEPQTTTQRKRIMPSSRILNHQTAAGLPSRDEELAASIEH